MRPLTNSLVKGLINIAKNIMSIIDIVNDSDILIYFLYAKYYMHLSLINKS